MKNNIKKASVKVLEDLLYFQHFCRFYLCPNAVIITTLTAGIIKDLKILLG